MDFNEFIDNNGTSKPKETGSGPENRENTSGRRVVAPGLIALGLLFLVNQVFNIDLGAQLWPFFIIVPGLPFLYLAFRGGKGLAGMIFPGLIITGTGVILLVQNTLDLFQTWAYLWAAYPVLVGFGMRFHGRRTDARHELQAGRALILIGGVLLVIFALFFELVIFPGTAGALTGYIVPLLLIGAGGFMLYRQGRLPSLPGRGKPAADRPDTGDQGRARGHKREPREEAGKPASDAAPRTDAAPRPDVAPSTESTPARETPPAVASVPAVPPASPSVTDEPEPEPAAEPASTEAAPESDDFAWMHFDDADDSSSNTTDDTPATAAGDDEPSPTISDDLRRQIDAALNDDDSNSTSGA